MALFLKKRVDAPTGALAEKMNLLASLQPPEDEEDMEFGFENGEEDYHEDTDEDGPPIEHDEHFQENPVMAPPPLKKPLRKTLAMMPESAAVEAPQPAPAPATVQRQRKTAPKEFSEKTQLSCKISRAHHSRLKIHSIVTGQSVMLILEEWIDRYCPPL